MTNGYPDQPARQKNIDALVAYFESGIKQADEQGKLGVEVEYFIAGKDDSPVCYSHEHGVAWLLEKLSATYPRKTFGTDHKIIGVARDDQSITLEPGAQIELSASPFVRVKDVLDTFTDFEKAINEALEPADEHLVARGYRPAGKAEDIELIPKHRYDYMNEHFLSISDYGRRMMRCSAATQISIDYYSVEDCLRKLRIASALAPLLALLCDNTPVFEDHPRTHKVMRSDVWLYCDPSRCGTVPHVLDPNFSFEAYANYILDTPAVVVPDGDDFRASSETFGEIYANVPMTHSDVEHAVSMFFTDARLKTYIEIRPADSMPAAYVASYAALIKGLFYSEENLAELDRMVADLRKENVDKARLALSEQGCDALVYGAPAHEHLSHLFELAENALDDEEKDLLKPLQTLVGERKTLADIEVLPTSTN